MSKNKLNMINWGQPVWENGVEIFRHSPATRGSDAWWDAQAQKSLVSLTREETERSTAICDHEDPDNSGCCIHCGLEQGERYQADLETL